MQTVGKLWVGRRFSLPTYVDEGEPYRPDAVMWLDAEHDLIRAFRLGRPPLASDVIAASLEEAIAAPMAGTPGEPRCVRVPEAELAAIARAVLSDGVEVEVGPVDELAAAVESLSRMVAAGSPGAGMDADDEGPPGRDRASARAKRRRKSRDDEREGYLCGGRVGRELVASLFDATARLAAAAPWRRTGDDVVLAIDIPALGLAGACLSIIGALGENLGFVLFDSAASFEAFLTLDERIAADPHARVQVPGYLLSLNLARLGELPAAMRREIRVHGWSVSDPRGYPQLMCIDPDGVPRPHAERDYRLAAACAAALAEFCATFAGDLDPPPRPPAERTITTVVAGDEIAVTLTLPHPGAALHADLSSSPPAPPSPLPLPRDPVHAPLEERRTSSPPFFQEQSARPGYPRDPAPAAPPAPRAWARVGRNDPCPCGSGRKFKRCHGDTAAADRGAAAALDQRAERAMRWHERDRRLLGEMLEVGKLRFSDDLRDVVQATHRMAGDGEGDGEGMLAHWIAYHAPLGDRSLVDRFVEVRGSYLTRADRDWLAAGRAAWFSIWEVADVAPGRSMELRDVLTGERRTVIESSASRSVARYDSLLARVVTVEDLSLLCGIHARTLAPRPADEVVRAVRRRLRLGTKPVAPERLRSEEAVQALVAAWDRVVASETARFTSPDLHNTDGHRLLLTTDRFRFATERRDEVIARLQTVGERTDAAVGGAGQGAARAGDASDPPGAAATADDTIRLSVARPSGFAGTGLDTVTVASLAIRRDLVLAETNSLERADEMRATIERVCAGLVEHAGRVHTDPSSPPVRAEHADRAARRSEEPPPPEASAAILELKRRHYEQWVDMPVPRLGDLTPREASRTAGGRRKLAVMLREIERIESRAPEGQRFDASGLWRELRIEALR